MEIQEKLEKKLQNANISFEDVAKKNPRVYQEAECLLKADNIRYEPSSGIFAALMDESWYVPLGDHSHTIRSAGGIGKSRVLILIKSDGEAISDTFQWRDQYNPRKDNDYNYLQSIEEIAVENERVIITCNTCRGSRQLSYSL